MLSLDFVSFLEREGFLYGWCACACVCMYVCACVCVKMDRCMNFEIKWSFFSSSTLQLFLSVFGSPPPFFQECCNNCLQESLWLSQACGRRCYGGCLLVDMLSPCVPESHCPSALPCVKWNPLSDDKHARLPAVSCGSFWISLPLTSCITGQWRIPFGPQNWWRPAEKRPLLEGKVKPICLSRNT